jgi:hypothetical protein
VPWLAGVPAARMVPVLRKFALAGWSGVDVGMALQDARQARGWHRVPELERPWAYLATLLREVDPAARPTVEEAAMEQFERESRQYEQLRVYGPPCPHGMPAGDVTSPRGTVACPFCRGADVELAEVLDVERADNWPEVRTTSG